MIYHCTDFQLGLLKSTNSGILTQLSRYKRAESNENGPQQGNSGSCLVMHLYYRFIDIPVFGLFLNSFIFKWEY